MAAVAGVAAAPAANLPTVLFQIGIIGENEEWLLVHQLSNEPDARSLEVQELNPYTFYR